MLNQEDTEPKRKLKVDLMELESAFEFVSWEMSYYLDLVTGQVIAITDEMRRKLEGIYEEATGEEEEDEPIDLADIILHLDLPEWQRIALLEADQVEIGYSSRYISVPQADSHEGYRDMAAFIVTVQDQHLQNRLWGAIEGRGAFRRFKDVLAGHRRERERWFEFKDNRVRQRVLDWLESEGIEPIIEPRPVPPPPPPARPRLIAEVLAFVRAAGQLPGVVRIALIGSLTTAEPDPDDADLLVMVADDTDLTGLAKLGRKLRGHTQSFNRGGEVFIAAECLSINILTWKPTSIGLPVAAVVGWPG